MTKEGFEAAQILPDLEKIEVENWMEQLRFSHRPERQKKERKKSRMRYKEKSTH